MTIVHSPGFRHLAFCWENPLAARRRCRHSETRFRVPAGHGVAGGIRGIHGCVLSQFCARIPRSAVKYLALEGLLAADPRRSGPNILERRAKHAKPHRAGAESPRLAQVNRQGRLRRWRPFRLKREARPKAGWSKVVQVCTVSKREGL